jgi:hypothetical protein
MKERCKLFHRKFPNKRIAVTSLRRLYLKNKVKRKKVRQEKYLPDKFKLKYEDERRRLLDELAKAKSQKRKLIFLDEVSFTKLAIQRLDWSQKNDSTKID